MIGMCMSDKYRIDLRKLMKWNTWWTYPRQKLSERRVEIRIGQETLSTKFN